MFIEVLRITVLVLVVVSATYAATLPEGFTETAISGLSNPTAMQIAPDGRIFVCQQGGALRVIKNGVLLSTPFITLTVDPRGERGLLGIAFDPNFATNNFFIFITQFRRVPGEIASAGSLRTVMSPYLEAKQSSGN